MKAVAVGLQVLGLAFVMLVMSFGSGYLGANAALSYARYTQPSIPRYSVPSSLPFQNIDYPTKPCPTC